MSRYFIPTDHDADPHGIILNRFFPFIEDLVERAIERADPQDGAEDIVTAFLDSHHGGSTALSTPSSACTAS